VEALMALGVESPTLSKVYIHENLPALCLEPLELSVKPGVENIAPVAHLLELPNAIRRPINFTRQRSVAKHLWPGGPFQPSSLPRESIHATSMASNIVGPRYG
jgi:hypothetical protein